MQGKANTTGKQTKTEAPQANPPRRAKKPLNLHLPKTIPSNSIEHRIILANGDSATNRDPRMRRTANVEHRRQIPPDMPTLPKKNRHNSNNRTPLSHVRSNGRNEIRLHQFKKRQRNRPGGAMRTPHLLSEPNKRLSPARIPSPMPKQNHPMHRHGATPNAGPPTSTQPAQARDTPTQA
jgi:hypothetical protein